MTQSYDRLRQMYFDDYVQSEVSEERERESEERERERRERERERDLVCLFII